MRTNFLFYLFITIQFSSLLAQSFPNDKQKFIKYIDQILAKNENEKVSSFASDKLKDNLLKNGTIDNGTFEQMVETCNTMEANGLKSYPDIFNYLYSINLIYEKKMSNESIFSWHSVLDNLLESKNKYTTEFLKFSIQFFLYGKISEAGSSKWFYKNGEFKFDLDKSPTISLKNGNLRCLLSNKSSGSNATDSIVIQQTNGELDISSRSWVGSGGTINWTKTGVPSEKMYVKIGAAYKLNLKVSEVKLDSVILTAPYFKNPIYGTIQDQNNTYLREIDRVYPRFTSYGKREKVNDIMEGIDFDGGFLIEGSKLIGSGTKENPSKILVKRENKPFITITSEIFEFSINSIQSNRSKLKISLGKDSIIHNYLNFSYNNQSKEVEITRPTKGRGLSPFMDSYHGIDFHAQRLLYKTGTDEIRLTYEYGSPIDLRNAKFESIDYFDEQLFDSFKGQDAVNPLSLAAKYCREKQLLEMSEGEFATAINKYLSQSKSLILEMAAHGFINYDTDEKLISVNDKLFRYADYKIGIRDFDNISFRSDLKPELKTFSKEELDQINSDKNLLNKYNQLIENETRRKSLPIYGVIDLKTSDLVIDGVDFITISNSQPTYISPKNLIIKVKKNREIHFDGTIFSGKIEIETELGKYNYNVNEFEIKNSKKALLTVNPFTDKDKELGKIEMKSFFSNVTGLLIVDDTSNRSGRNKEFTVFPKLSVTKPCTIFYDNILKGAYDSARFFVTLEPFDLDSLDNFKEKSLSLSGELTSAGIFPKIKENIRIMDDYSFGFSTKAPDNGYSFYGGNTNYNNKIILSANGLQGAGTINFLNSISESKALTFLPDSTIGLAKFINNPTEDKIQFPDVYNERSFICYIPKAKILKASSTGDNPMRLFNNEAHLGGTLLLKETGMTGFGEVGFKTASMQSSNYHFTRWDILADTSNFYLKNIYRSQGEDPLALKVSGVSANISFKERKGTFNAGKTERIDFPANSFYCQMDRFFWYMDGSTVDMEKNKDNETSFQTNSTGEVSNFRYYKSNLDSSYCVDFKSMNAKYDLKEQQIYCNQVSNFKVGDIFVLPDSSKLVVQKAGNIKPMINSALETDNKKHFFEQCYIEVRDKKNLTAKGKYRYIDVDDDLSLIQMDDILCENGNTTAKGLIDEKRGFKLSKQFDFFGNIEVLSKEDSIRCFGSTRVSHDCKYKKTWFVLNDKVNPKNIQIPIGANLVNTDEQPLGIGFYYGVEKGRIYTTFLSTPNLPEDQLLYTAQGYLQYNKSTNEYQVSTKEQLQQRNQGLSSQVWTTDNYLALSLENNSCNMFGEGEIDLKFDLNDVKIQSFGSIEYDAVNNKKTTINISSRFSFPVDQGVMEGLAKKVVANESINPAKQSEIGNTNLYRALKHWSSGKDKDKDKVFQKIKEEIVDESLKKVPKEIEQTLVLSDIKLVNYGTENLSKLKTNSTHSLLFSMYEKPVLKYIPFELLLEQNLEPKSKDRFAFNIGLEDKFYFFDYQTSKNNGIMNITSNDAIFKKSITDLKPKVKKVKDFEYDFTEDSKYYDEFKINIK